MHRGFGEPVTTLPRECSSTRVRGGTVYLLVEGRPRCESGQGSRSTDRAFSPFRLLRSRSFSPHKSAISLLRSRCPINAFPPFSTMGCSIAFRAVDWLAEMRCKTPGCGRVQTRAETHRHRGWSAKPSADVGLVLILRWRSVAFSGAHCGSEMPRRLRAWARSSGSSGSGLYSRGGSSGSGALPHTSSPFGRRWKP